MPDSIKKLTILHSNDMHGDFLPRLVHGKEVGGLARLSGYVNKISKVVLVPLPEDKPGALSEVLGILNEEKININYMYAVNGDDNKTYMVLKVNDSNAAELALEARGIHPGDQEVLTQV